LRSTFDMLIVDSYLTALRSGWRFRRLPGL
jgi:hypothetical protein